MHVGENLSPSKPDASGSPTEVLFQPFRLGGVVLRNRMLMAPLGTENADDGCVSDAMIRYYERRAEGGVGLIQVEFCAVDMSSVANSHLLRLDEDRFLPGMRKLVDRVHAHGVPVVLQLAHTGRQMSARIAGMQPVGPSAIPCPLVKDVPRALKTEEVEYLVDQFAAAAVRAKDAGFDGVQIHGAHGYLVHQFVSPVSNHRADRYGGSWENRARFPVAVVERVRAAVGPEFLIGYKISALEYLDGGLTLEDTTELARRVEAAGVDYIEVSSATYADMQHMIQPMMFKRGYLAPLAAHMKRNLRVPVVAVGRINDPQVAEEILSAGNADLVALGRGLLADPDLPRKARDGLFDEIRRCVACNECISLAFARTSVACLINPEASREGQIDLSPAKSPKSVLVVGAGPAGIQAALTAGLRGHRVVLCDRNAAPGGKLPIVAAPPGKQEFEQYLDYLKVQLSRSRVDVRTGTEVDEALVNALQPDEIVLATGASARIPAIPGVHRPNVCSADMALQREIAGQRIIVLGASGTGCETAQFLRENGHDVTVVARSSKAAQSIEPIARKVVLQEMQDAGVKFVFGLECSEIGVDRIVCADKEGARVELACDAVVIARGYDSDSALAERLRAQGYTVRVIGDALEPRKIIDAVTEGYLAAAAI